MRGGGRDLNEASVEGADTEESLSWPTTCQGFPQSRASHHHPPIQGTDASSMRPTEPRFSQGSMPYGPGGEAAGSGSSQVASEGATGGRGENQ